MFASWLTFAVLWGTFCAGKSLSACLPPARALGRVSKCRIEWAVRFFAATFQHPRKQSEAPELGNPPTTTSPTLPLLLLLLLLFYFSFHSLALPLRFLPALRTSLPVLLFVPSRQPVGIHGNVNTARSRGNFAKMGIYFWAGARGRSRGCCWGGGRVGISGRRAGGRSGMLRGRSGSGHVCAPLLPGCGCVTRGEGVRDPPLRPEGTPPILREPPGTPRSRRG